jgi:hypothetical protein
VEAGTKTKTMTTCPAFLSEKRETNAVYCPRYADYYFTFKG